MKFDVKEDKLTEFLAGLALFIAGVMLFAKNIYVSSPLFGQGIRIGGMYLRSGICVLPCVAGLIAMFARPKSAWPKVIAIAGFLFIIAIAIFSVNIRVRAIPLMKWIILLAMIFGGVILICRAVYLKKKDR